MSKIVPSNLPTQLVLVGKHPRPAPNPHEFLSFPWLFANALLVLRQILFAAPHWILLGFAIHRAMYLPNSFRPGQLQFLRPQSNEFCPSTRLLFSSFRSAFAPATTSLQRASEKWARIESFSNFHVVGGNGWVLWRSNLLYRFTGQGRRQERKKRELQLY